MKFCKSIVTSNCRNHVPRAGGALALLLTSIGLASAEIICIPVRVTNSTDQVSHNVCDTNCVALSVGVGGTRPVLYQWYFSGTRLREETNASLTLCRLTERDEGDYQVAITNPCSRTSVVMRLTVYTDTQPPVITCPSDRTVVACLPSGSRVLFNPPLVDDDHDPDVAVTCTPRSGSVFPLGQTTVHCTATDDCTNRSSCAFDVTVAYDIFAPAIHCPGDLTVVTCSVDGSEVTFPTPSTRDDYDTNVTVTCTPASGSFFPVGTTVVTCLATDNCGRTNSCRFQVTVRTDSAPPVLTCPGNFTVGACSPNGTPVCYPSLSATDDADPSVTITCNPTNGSTMLIGSHFVRCTALDTCGRRDDCSFTVLVVANTNTVNPKLASITPSLISTQGGTALTVTGEHLGAADQVYLNGQPLENQLWVSARTILGMTPPLDSGSITVTVRRCSTSPVATLSNAGEAAPPPRLISVEPARAYARGGSRVILHGENLRPETQFHVALAGLDSVSNQLRNVVVATDGLAAMGEVPPLPAGQVYGPRALLAEDTRGHDPLLPGISYVPNPVETEPQVVALRQLEQISLRRPWINFRKGFPSSMNVRVPVPGAQAEERARNFLRINKELFLQADPDTDLVVRRKRLGLLDHVHFSQRYRGLPVFGADLLVMLKSNQVYLTAGHLVPSARLADLPTVPAFDSARAVDLARARLNRPQASVLTVPVLGIFDLGFLRDEKSNPRLVWQVALGGGKHQVLSLDAQTGEPLFTAGLAQSDGAPMDGFDFDMVDAEDEANPEEDDCFNLSDDVDVANEDWFNDDYLGDPDAVWGNQHARDAYAFFHGRFAWHSYDEAGSQLEVFIHATVCAGIAEWSPSCDLIAICSGHVDREVMTHEFTHGIIEHSGGLGSWDGEVNHYAFQPGALNEHYADMMALVADWEAGDTNWLHAEDRTGFPGVATRDLSNPVRDHFAEYDYGTPDENGEYPDNGYVHRNSGIPTKAAYFMATGYDYYGVHFSGLGITKLRDLKWNALINLPSVTHFDDACLYEVTTAEAWGESGAGGFNEYDVCVVRNAWGLVGLGGVDFLCYGPWYIDMDGDHVFDFMDNCPYKANPDQADWDDDGVGDACDNCPHNKNEDQADYDDDEVGDVCDPDLDGDGCLNGADQHPAADMVQVGSYFSVCCDNAPMLGDEGENSDDDRLVNCEDPDDDNDGIPDFGFDGIPGTPDDDPCPTGATGPDGTCSEYADCPCTPNNWRVACAGGGCQMFFAKFSWVMNPDPATDVIFDHVELRNQQLYLIPSLGNSPVQAAQAIGQRAGMGMSAVSGFVPGDRRRLEIWSRATANGPAQLEEVIGEFDPGRINWQQLALGSLLAVKLPTDSLSPWSIGAAWRVGGDPAEAASDLDQDGLPDGWELHHGLNHRDPRDADQDLDRDGASNRHEFDSGTDPRNPASCFRLTEVKWQGRSVRVRFNTELGRRYQLERRFSLAPGPVGWVPVGPPGTAGAVVIGTGGPMEVSDSSPTASIGFYRLTLLPE